MQDLNNLSHQRQTLVQYIGEIEDLYSPADYRQQFLPTVDSPSSSPTLGQDSRSALGRSN